MLVTIRQLNFSYLPERPLFRNFTLEIAAGQTVAIAGESGCGKSTLLSLLYGLLDFKEGEILFEGKPILGPKNNLVPGEPQMKMVAQNYDLMPYATVAENIGKYITNINLADKKAQVNELLDLIELTTFRDTLPKYLSGGQQQRVALARALAVMPKLLLLDEPFSNLDFARTSKLRENLFRYVKEKEIGLIISTHDLQEVLPWLDRIVVLQDGRLIQNDTPAETFHQPYNAYVARLFGEVNELTEEARIQWQLPKNLYYPHEIVPDSEGLQMEVLESRFAGSHFRTLLSLGDTTLISYTAEKLHGTIHVRFK